MNIKNVAKQDFPILLDLQVKCIQSLTATYSQDEINAWVGYIEQAGAVRFAAFTNKAWHNTNGDIIGFISWIQHPNSSVSIECLYVRKEDRNNGIGTRLLGEAQKIAGLLNGPLDVRSTQNARRLYEQNGFRFQADAVSRAGFSIALLRQDAP